MDTYTTFGILPFFAIAASSTIWNSSALWGDGNDRTLFPSERDEAGTQFTGEGRARIDGEGVLHLVGDAPRYRVLEPTFGNVSIVLYAMRVAEEQDLSYQGFVIGARSQHYTDAECGANTYYASITKDGEAHFEKELFHGQGNNAFYPRLNSNNPSIFEDDGETIPKNVWIGLNFTIVTTVEGNARLELAVDKGDGEGFQNVLDYEDDGDWPVDPGDATCEGFYPDNKIIQSPGMVFIRNDGIEDYQYKNLVIKEVGGIAERADT